jgi:murein DD-endopeptidase MepM/ murein hydrolase activator NlpD
MSAAPLTPRPLHWLRRSLALLILASALLIATAELAWAATDPPPRHSVQPGDTLSAIAQHYGSTVPALMAANGLTDPDSLAVGQILIAPAAAQPLRRIETRPRDTLASVAQRYAVDLTELQAINGLTPGQRLAPGQDLLAPVPSDQPSPALPPGPIRSISISPAVARQGETVAVQIHVDASQPLSLSLKLDPQIAPLFPIGAEELVGLVAVHALTDPGYVWLDLSWQGAGEAISQTLRWPIPVIEAGYPTYDIILPDDKGDLLAPELVQAELERMIALWSEVSEPPSARWLFQRPIAPDYLTSAPFGQRRSYNSGPVSGFHAGQDFAAPAGVPVYAPAAGVVVLADPLQVRGNAVLIDHGDGVFSGYWHLTDIVAQVGQQVQPGDLLGHVGTTGLSTGNHLHWELRVNGFAVDPMQWLTTRFP